MRELGLVVRSVGFGGDGEAFGEGKELVKSTGPRENERGRVQDDVVAHPVRVGVGNKAVVRPIMRESRAKIISNASVVVPLGSAVGFVGDKEGAAWCHRV